MRSYWITAVSMAAEIRPPTKEELAKPLVVTEDATKHKATETPGVEGYKIVEAVVTVEGLDRQTQTVTVKGPKGTTSRSRSGSGHHREAEAR